jgi:hypothetical protein
LQAVEEGSAETAVDRLSGRSDPRGSGSEITSRERQTRSKREVAEELDISREGVGSVDRLGGLDVFLRSPGVNQFGDDVASDFASQADFVQPGDVDPNVDGDEISANPVVAAARRDDVAARARQQTAADQQFITAADLDAEVGPRGVADLGIAQSRRDNVASRTAQQLAADDRFAKPGDFNVDVGESGILSAGLSDSGERRRAGRQLESQTALSEVDPNADLTQRDGGFALDTEAQRRAAARNFESDIGLFGSGELDPTTDLRPTDSGFGLARDEAREVAADRIDEQVSQVDVGPGDITLTETDSGEFEASFETEVRR